MAPLASVSYLKPVSSRFLGQISVPDKKRRAQKKLLWLKGRDQTHLSECSVLDSFSCTWVPSSEGSGKVIQAPGTERARPPDQISFCSLLTFSSTMRKFRSRPVAAFLQRASAHSQPSWRGSAAPPSPPPPPLPAAPRDCAVTVGWGTVSDQDRSRTVKISVEGMWVGEGGSRCGGVVNNLPALLQEQISTGGRNCPHHLF